MSQKIDAPSADELERLKKQRAWVREHYEPESRGLYETLDGKLRLLGIILEQKWIEPTETWKLQSLGITFGDALAQELGLFWVSVEDEYGRDPALHDRGTTIVLFPLTTILKRIERGETVDVRALFVEACQTVVGLRAKKPGGSLH